MARKTDHYKKAHDALMKAQDHLDKLHESKGMSKFEGKSKPQKEALKGKSKKKRDEIKGGEKANVKLRKERSRKKY